MRHLALFALLLLAGCRNVIGPFDPRPPVRVDDPRLSIEEQQALGRQFLALPDESPLAGPPSGAARRENDVGQRLGR
jgi:hypothetical protein